MAEHLNEGDSRSRSVTLQSAGRHDDLFYSAMAAAADLAQKETATRAEFQQWADQFTCDHPLYIGFQVEVVRKVFNSQGDRLGWSCEMSIRLDAEVTCGPIENPGL